MIPLDDGWKKMAARARPKVPVDESLSPDFIDFMEDVEDKIDAGELAATMESDDSLQTDNIVGGLYDSIDGRYGFEQYFGQRGNAGHEITWYYDLTVDQIRDIAHKRISALRMWRCQPDCGLRFGHPESLCPKCDQAK